MRTPLLGSTTSARRAGIAGPGCCRATAGTRCSTSGTGSHTRVVPLTSATSHCGRHFERAPAGRPAARSGAPAPARATAAMPRLQRSLAAVRDGSDAISWGLSWSCLDVARLSPGAARDHCRCRSMGWRVGGPSRRHARHASRSAALRGDGVSLALATRRRCSRYHAAGMTSMLQQRRRHHAAHHRRGDARHDLRAGAAAPHDRQQAGHHDGHGHGLGPHAQHGALANRGQQRLVVVRLAGGEAPRAARSSGRSASPRRTRRPRRPAR